jgi:YD repeat-containing protein
MKSILAVLFVIGVLIGALSVPTEAQTNTCILQAQYCGICGDPGTGFFDCTQEISILDRCNVMNPQCPPTASPSETRCPLCQAIAALPTIATAGYPISLADGNTYIQENDLRLPGLGGGLTLIRTWNSLWPSTQTAFQTGIFGPNWRSTFEERVFVGSDNYIKYARSDGTFWSFGYSGGTWVIAAPRTAIATLVQGPSYWTLTFKNGEQRLFDNTSGSLIAIIDRDGNTTQLSYNAIGYVSTVTDPAGRTLSFTYGNQSFPGLVTSVTSSAGPSISYSYDSQGRLTQVTEPDSSTFNFQYNTQSLITSVTDSQGVTLESHTYDSDGRGLTSSRANGVEAVSVSYPN